VFGSQPVDPGGVGGYYKSIPNASKIKSKSFQHSNKIRLKNEPLHVARGPVFSATGDPFSATGNVFEGFGRGAAPESKKVSTPEAFGAPAANLSGPKV